MKTFTLNIRPKRQATFQETLLQEVGLKVGDKLTAQVKNNEIVLKPQKQVALNALKEIQRLVKESGVSEKEMQDNLKKIRQEDYDQRYDKTKGVS
jgi:antitoxin component of MazEF toxin-antitoxin module